VRLLLDTHPFLWLHGDRQRVPHLISLLEEGNDGLVSAATVWEIAIKYPLGKLTLPETPDTFIPSRIRASGLTAVPVTHAHALAVSELPTFDDHRDPFDRLLIATARVETIPIVSVNPAFPRYDVELMRP